MIALVVGVVSIAAFVRFHRLGEQNYWLDELHSMVNSAGFRNELESLPHGVILRDIPRYPDLVKGSTVTTTWRTMTHDSHPPLYFVLLHMWRKIVGDSEFATRALAALFSILAIIPVAMTLRLYNRDRLAPWVGIGLALAFSHVLMAQENRPYSLGMLLVAVSFYLLVRMERDWAHASARRLTVLSILYGSSVYLAVMTHYFTALPLAVQGIYALARFRNSLRWSWGMVVAVAGSVWAVTWGATFAGQLDFIAGQEWLLEDRPDHALCTLMRVTDLPLRLLFDHERFSFSIARSLAGGGLLVALVAMILRRRSACGLVFTLWFIVPVGVFLAIDATTERQLLSHIRYTSIAVPGLVGMIVLAIAQLPRIAVRGVTMALLISAALTLRLPTQSNPQSRRAARLIAEQLTEVDLLVYDAVDWPSFSASQTYLTASYYLPNPQPPFVLLRDPPGSELLSQMAMFPRIVVVSPSVDHVPNPDPDRFVHVDQTGYIYGIGIVHLFARLPGAS